MVAVPASLQLIAYSCHHMLQLFHTGGGTLMGCPKLLTQTWGETSSQVIHTFEVLVHLSYLLRVLIGSPSARTAASTATCSSCARAVHTVC
jgi:hypothetical protein